jgi:hypothetical protein
VPIRRRRPLLRAAAVGGGAYYMGKRRAETQSQEGVPSQEGAVPAPPGPPTTSEGMNAEAVQRLQELAELHAQGVLTDEEFASQKARLLG